MALWSILGLLENAFLALTPQHENRNVYAGPKNPVSSRISSRGQKVLEPVGPWFPSTFLWPQRWTSSQSVFSVTGSKNRRLKQSFKWPMD